MSSGYVARPASERHVQRVRDVTCPESERRGQQVTGATANRAKWSDDNDATGAADDNDVTGASKSATDDRPNADHTRTRRGLTDT